MGTHYTDVIMSTMASQITSLTIVYSIVYSGVDQTKHQSSTGFAWGIHRWPVNSTHKRPVTQKIFPFDDVIMFYCEPVNDEHSFTECTDSRWDLFQCLIWYLTIRSWTRNFGSQDVHVILKFSNLCQTSTHWGQDKIAAISQTTFSNAFSQMKMYEFH